MTTRTKLQFTKAVQNAAIGHGAYFDESEQAWFVDGEVPGPLIAYVVTEARQRDYVANSLREQCKCGAHMVTRRNRTTGELFWACSVPRCGVTMNFDDGIPLSNAASRSGPIDGAAPSFENKDGVAAVITRAIELFRNEGLATAWLKSPKVALKGETPLQAMTTQTGCNAVARLLEERFD